jgi:MFS family permease
MADAAPSKELLDRITRKRMQIEAFLSAARPRKRRLLNTTIVGGSLAAVLTAAPAIGGQSLTASLTEALGLASPSWRLLCAIAAVSSVVATIATQLLKSQNLEEHVTRALSCRARLEVLEVGVTLGQLDVQRATADYLKCVEEAVFLETP